MSFPERDETKPAEEQGLFRKFEVRRTDGSDQPGGKHEGCRYFVLDMDCDPHARAALKAYAESCRESHPKLSAELLLLAYEAPVPGQPDSEKVSEKRKEHAKRISDQPDWP